MASATAPASAAGPYKTGWLWGVLTILLAIGTAASAGVVYGVSLLVLGGNVYAGFAAILIGFSGALLSFLLLAGMLYRIDRLRGVPHRTVTLFE